MISEKPYQHPAPQLLIRTKLFAPPPRPRFVSRPRLVSRLRQASQYPLTLVCAPAGYGKTMLLAEWLAEGEIDYPAAIPVIRKRVGWLSLDTEDNDPSRFLAYLLAALQTIDAMIGSDAQALLQSTQPIPPQTILAALINDLQVQSHPLWLVLDDYQFIDNTSIHESIIFFLEHLPSAVHLLIATRSDPPFPLYRLRARNQLLELRTDDLRFTAEEAAAFLNQVMDLSLTIDDIDTLERRTEGWIAGLQMAALALQGQRRQGRANADRSAFVRDFGGSHRYVLEYLIEEILHRQPARIQTFLLRTSILDRLCAPLCHAVLSGSAVPSELQEHQAAVPMEMMDSRESLDYLEHANLFITTLDETRSWYRYHHLFADLLKARLVQSQPELLPVLYTRASLWYEQEGLPEEAIKYALAANALERAGLLVERYTMEILNRGEMSVLLHFLQSLPEDLVNHHPGLCIQYAWALTFSGQLGLAETRLAQAEAQIQPGDSSPLAREILGSAAIIRGLIAEFRGDLPAAVQLARKADALIPADNYQARSVIPYVLGDGYYADGDLQQAEIAYEQIRQIGRKSGNLWTSEVALYKLSLVKKLQGKLRAVWELHQAALQLAAEKQCLRAGSMGATYVGLSEIQREWNALEDAQQTATQALRIMEHWPSPTDRVNAYLSLARVAIAQGNLASAEEVFTEAVEIGRSTKLFPATQANLDACQVRLWLAKDEVAAVRQWVEDRAGKIEALFGEKPDFVAEREGLTLARGLMVLGPDGVDQAIRLLRLLADTSRVAGQRGILIEALALLTHGYHIRGNTIAATKTIWECLALAEEENFLRVFLDEGETMRAVLEDFQTEAAKGSAPARLPYVTKILSAFPPILGKASLPSMTALEVRSRKDARIVPEARTAKSALIGPDARSAKSELIEPLSQRELEVLGLICQGASNQEIAAKLVVTLNTIKKHNNRIFGKLGVTSRVQAVLQARRLGLVPESGFPPEE